MIAGQKAVRRSSWRRNETMTGWMFALPAILGFLILTLIPMVVSLFLSMTDYSAFKSEIRFIGLDNFKTMFGSTELYFSDSLKATAYYAVLNVPASLLVAFLIALALNTNIRGRGIFRSIFYLPSIVPAVASCVVWMWRLNQPVRPADDARQAARHGHPRLAVGIRRRVIPTIVMTGLWNTGGTMVIFLAGLQGIPQVYYEALSVDGGNAWHKLWHITIPMLTPTIFFNGIMAVINSLQVFTQGYIMTKGGPSNSSLFYVLYLYRQAFEKANMATPVRWPGSCLSSQILTAIIMKSQNKWVYYGGD